MIGMGIVIVQIEVNMLIIKIGLLTLKYSETNGHSRNKEMCFVDRLLTAYV